MSVPNTVTVATASTTDSVDIIKDLLIKDNAKPTTNKRTRQSNEEALSALNYMGGSYDVYQLQGEDKTGQKDAIVVALDVKQIAQQVAKDKTNDPMFVAAMAALDKGQIDPVTEQLMLGAINKQIPTTTTVVPLNNPARYAHLKTQSGKPIVQLRTLTVENAEQVHK